MPFSLDLAGPGSSALTPLFLLMLFVIFVLGGTVKGALGVGLPLVVVPLLSLVLPSPTAIALVVVPVLASNSWQAIDSGFSWGSLRRFAPMLATLLVTTLVTVPWTLAMPVKMLNWMLAGAVICAVALMSCRPKFDIPPRQEAAWSTGVGALSGLMGGISSLTGPVVISYLMALKLSREEFVGSVSVIYLFGAVPLYGSMVAHHRLGASEALVSAIAMVPVACGLAIGKRLRGHLDEWSFRRVLLTFLIVVALALILK